jgi:glycine/D-amino acid oxidase-like deaminating enzyme
MGLIGWSKRSRCSSASCGLELPHFPVRASRPNLRRCYWQHLAGRGAADQVLAVTNGYTSRALWALRRSVLPIGSSQISTDPVDPGLTSRLVPPRRVFGDPKDLLHYFRLSPEGRMVLGGRASFTPASVRRSPGIFTGRPGIFTGRYAGSFSRAVPGKDRVCLVRQGGLPGGSPPDAVCETGSADLTLNPSSMPSLF